LQPEQIKALELRLTGHDVLAMLPTGYGRVNLSSILFGKALHLEPECKRVSSFAAQLQVTSIVQKLLEQFRKYELTELGLSAVHFKD